jgi:hypothetical protein
MSPIRVILALLATSLFARGESFLETTVTRVPADATALVFVVDVVAPPEAPSYDDAQPPPPAPPAPQAPKAAADPTAAAQQPPQPQQRRRRNLNAAKPPPAVRTEMKLSSPASTVTWRTSAPTGDNVRIRVVAVKGDAAFPLVIASGKIVGLTTTDTSTPVSVALTPSTLKLAPDVPQTVAPGAKFILAGTITDPGSFLGTKNRLRVWLSPGTPPAADRAGTQISTIDVTTKDDDVTFAFELTAPSEPGALYYQFGEVSADFARADGSQAPFLMLPAAGAGTALQVNVQRITATATLTHE